MSDETTTTETPAPKKRAPRKTAPAKPIGKKEDVADFVTTGVLDEVRAERRRQDARWGEQNHPLIGGAWAVAARNTYGQNAANWKQVNEQRVRTNTMGWDSIAAEELFEALEAKTLELAREEYVQLAAVAVAAIESIDRKLAARAAA